MALSEYERRLLTEIEADLQRVPSTRMAALRAAVVRQYRALLCAVCALATIAVVIAFPDVRFLAPLAAVFSAVGGYQLCVARDRSTRPRG